jgi:RAB protein geranylgeranyltransferase component A
MSDLPKKYDIIISGTGLTESILAAAFSRIGKSVLHIDRLFFFFEKTIILLLFI